MVHCFIITWYYFFRKAFFSEKQTRAKKNGWGGGCSFLDSCVPFSRKKEQESIAYMTEAVPSKGQIH